MGILTHRTDWAHRHGLLKKAVLACLCAMLCLTLAVSTAAASSLAMSTSTAPAAPVAPVAPAAPFLAYRVAAVHAHDPSCFTQGLQIHSELVYESSGLYGQSFLRVWNLATGTVLRQAALPRRYFAEGLALANGEVVLLTWREGTALRFDARDLSSRGSFAYEGQGWGLAFDGARFIQSDGSEFLTLRDSETFAVLGRVAVTDQGLPVRRLNELAWVPETVPDGSVVPAQLAGRLLANVWLTERIAVIDPVEWVVLAWLDLSALTAEAGGHDPEAVANGVTFDPCTGRLLVTGKRWSFLYELELTGADGQ